MVRACSCGTSSCRGSPTRSASPLSSTTIRRVRPSGTGSSSGNTAGGGGGGGGGYAEGWFAVTPGQVIPIMVGSGGTPGFISGTTPTNGGAGGSSSIGSFLTAAGGSGGVSNYNSFATTGAPGGAATGGTAFPGFVGGISFATGTVVFGAQGGASFGTSTSYPGGLGQQAPIGVSPGGGGSAARSFNGTGAANGPGAKGFVNIQY